MKHIAVIGGGAAGLCAAISAAFQARACNIPVQIHVFEAHAKLGHSILATGNGRCNISHEAFLSSDEQQALHACTGADPWDLGSCMPSMGANNICEQEKYIEQATQALPYLQESQLAQHPHNACATQTTHDVQGASITCGVRDQHTAHNPQAAYNPQAAHNSQAAYASVPLEFPFDSNNPLHHFHNSAFVKITLERLQQAALHGEIACIPHAHANSYDAALSFFSHLGLAFRCDDQGWLFPYSNTAKTVRELLIATAQRLGIGMHASTEISELAASSSVLSETTSFTITTSEGKKYSADAVIAAWGGKHSHASLALLGHSVKTVPCVPVLGSLICTYPNLKKLDTIRLRAQVHIVRTQNNTSRIIASEQGEVLFRSYGVSGIAVFNVSRFVHAGDVVSINALNMPISEATEFLKHKLEQVKILNTKACWNDVLYGMFPAAFVDVLCAQEISNNASPACVARALCDMRLPIESVKADQCLVMRGGIAINEVDAQTLRVSNSSALYAVGEALDVDASCGGFNLHWAWSSGILAGACAVNTWRDAS